VSVTDPRENLAMLRRFEPLVRYTRGERFFPMDVDRYISQCSLWVQRPDGDAELLVPQGELDIDKLIEPRHHGFGAVYFLKFIEPLDLGELARHSFNQAVTSIRKALRLRLYEQGDRFRAGKGRLARVGYGSRFVDALFSLTLVLRGRVPGDTSIAAGIIYRNLQAGQERYCYYGRVVRENGWVVLQYWYFYPFNNWRSGFFGVNDHEGDWEMVCIYCSEKETQSDTIAPEERLTPEWIAYASHDFSGDDLRRRWDDPEVEKVIDAQGNSHPIVYAGAGSHASYFSRGDYLAELELPFLSPLVRLVDKVQELWVKVLRQAIGSAQGTDFNVFRIPFVDYARGDGLSIGPGQVKNWQPECLEEQTNWAMDYRGLWGLYAQDPIAGENAPAGPVYNRDGTVRQSWYDPLGWAGLEKLPPPDEMLLVLERRRGEINEERLRAQEEIQVKSAALQRMGVEAAALDGQPHLEQAHKLLMEQIRASAGELQGLRERLSFEDAKLDALALYEERLQLGERGPLRAHIRRAHHPSSEGEIPLASVAEFIAAVSIGVLMVGIVLLTVFARQYLLIGLAVMIGVLIFVEAGFRRQLPRLINSLTVGLAIVSALVLIFEFFWQIVVVAVIAAGLFIMWENLREITL
jgi:hypothetical protein